MAGINMNNAAFTWKNLEKRKGDGKGGGFEVVWLLPFAAIFKASETQFLHRIPSCQILIRTQIKWVISNSIDQII